MIRLGKLKIAIDSLAEEEYGELRRWFLERDWEKWDRQIEDDSAAGKMDFLRREAQGRLHLGLDRVPRRVRQNPPVALKVRDLQQNAMDKVAGGMLPPGLRLPF